MPVTWACLSWGTPKMASVVLGFHSKPKPGGPKRKPRNQLLTGYLKAYAEGKIRPMPMEPEVPGFSVRSFNLWTWTVSKMVKVRPPIPEDWAIPLQHVFKKSRPVTLIKKIREKAHYFRERELARDLPPLRLPKLCGLDGPENWRSSLSCSTTDAHVQAGSKANFRAEGTT